MKRHNYACFLPSVQAYRAQVTSYFDFKFYNSNFGDCLPLIAANTLQFQIIITSSERIQLQNC